MRRYLISALMIPLLFLAGCGEREVEPEAVFSTFREEMNAAGSVEAAVSLTADYGGTVEEYALSVVSDGMETAVTVTAPEIIAGVTATAAAGETSLSFDGVILGAGPVDPEGTTPLSAVPAILRAMAEGYAELYWRDGSYAAARIYAGESSSCTIWLEPEERTPIAAEISADGRTVISCRFTDWEME